MRDSTLRKPKNKKPAEIGVIIMENRGMGDVYQKDKCFEDHSIMHPCSASSSELEEIDFHTLEDLCGECVSDEEKNPCNITSEQEIVSEDTCSDKTKSACVKYYPIPMTQEVQCEAVSIDICSGLMNSIYDQYDQVEMKIQGVQCTWNRRDQGTQTDPEVSLQSSGALGPTTCSCSKISMSNQQLKSSCKKDSSNSGSDEKLTDSLDEHSGTAPLPFGPSFEGEVDEAPSYHSTSSSLLPLGGECSESRCSASGVLSTQCGNIIRSSSLEENKMCCSVLETSDGVEIVNNENEQSEGSSQCDVLKSLNKDCRSHITFNSCSLKQKTEGNVEVCKGEFSQNIEKSHETVSPANKSSDNVDNESSVRKLLSQSGVIEESSETGDDNTQSIHSEKGSSHSSTNNSPVKKKNRREVCRRKVNLSSNIEKSHKTCCPNDKGNNNLDGSFSEDLLLMGNIEDFSKTDGTDDDENDEKRSSHSATNNSPLKNKKRREVCRGKVKELSDNIEKSLEIGCPIDKGDNNLDEDPSAEELILQMGNIEDSSENEDTQSIHGENRSSRRSHSATNTSPLKNKKRQEVDVREVCRGKIKESSNIEKSCETNSPGDKISNNMDEVSSSEDLEIGCNENVIEDSHCRYGRIMSVLEIAEKRRLPSPKPGVSRSSSTRAASEGINLPSISSLAVERCSSPESLGEVMPEDTQNPNIIRQRKFVRKKRKLVSKDDIWLSDCEENDKRSDKLTGEASAPKPSTSRKRPLVLYSDDTSCDSYEQSGSGTSYAAVSRSAVKRTETLSVDSDSESVKSVYFVNHNNRKPLKHPRRPYTERERESIVAYIVDRKLYHCTGGNAMWKQMEREKICPGHPWQSMREHFRKQILPHIGSYGLPSKVVQRFLQQRKT